jgi:hypothetical protein
VTRARPSDLYRLPGHRVHRPEEAHDEERPRSRWPAATGAALLLVVGLGLVLAPRATPDGPVVDIVSEDQAVAALQLYAAQAAVVADLRAQSDIFAPPGPPQAARRAAEGVEEVERALQAAQGEPGPDPLVAEYWYADDHRDFLERLRMTGETAGQVSVLAATHDTLYGGSGSIPLQEAQHRIASEFQSTPNAGVLAEWGETLLREIDGAEVAGRAADLREDVRGQWPAWIEELWPLPAEETLRTYVAGLPQTTVDGLRGHPVAGPALERLSAR